MADLYLIETYERSFKSGVILMSEPDLIHDDNIEVEVVIFKEGLFLEVNSENIPIAAWLFILEKEGNRSMTIGLNLDMYRMWTRMVSGIESEPVPLDFVVDFLKASGLNINKVAINAVIDEIIYADVHSTNAKGEEFIVRVNSVTAIFLSFLTQCPLFVLDRYLIHDDNVLKCVERTKQAKKKYESGIPDNADYEEMSDEDLMRHFEGIDPSKIKKH